MHWWDGLFIRPQSRTAWFLPSLALIQAILVTAFQSITIVNETTAIDELSNKARGLKIYCGICIVAGWFSFLLSAGAVLMQSKIEMYSFLIFDCLNAAYAIMQYLQVNDESTRARLVGNIIVWISFLPCFLIAGKILRSQISWWIYKRLGADPAMRSSYLYYATFWAILKLDVFFLLGFSLQYLFLVLKQQNNTTAESILVIGGLILCVFSFVFVVIGLLKEHEKMTMIGGASLVMQIIYFIWRGYMTLSSMHQPLYENVWRILTLFTAIKLVLAVLTLINIVICRRNFGKGLSLLVSRKINPIK